MLLNNNLDYLGKHKSLHARCAVRKERQQLLPFLNKLILQSVLA